MIDKILLVEPVDKDNWRVAWRECCATGPTKKFVQIGGIYANQVTARLYFAHLKYGGIEPRLPKFNTNYKRLHERSYE